MTPRLSEEAQAQIISAIRAAEATTSAEIRVHVETRGSEDPIARARQLFAEQGMTRTAQRNAVLVYVSFPLRKCAVWGDAGAHQLLGESLWEDVCRRLASALTDRPPEHAIVDTVAWLGRKLAEAFPRSPSDVNELPDDLRL